MPVPVLVRPVLLLDDVDFAVRQRDLRFELVVFDPLEAVLLLVDVDLVELRSEVFSERVDGFLPGRKLGVRVVRVWDRCRLLLRTLRPMIVGCFAPRRILVRGRRRGTAR